MKVNIGPYINYIGPYQIVQKIFFWKDWYSINDDSFIIKLADRLTEDKNENPTMFTKLCRWIDDKRKRKVLVKVHDYDLYSADHTLAMIIVPVIKQLKIKKMGWYNIDDKDVPKHLRSTSAPELTDDEKERGIGDEFEQQRYDWVLDEIIWSFEQHSDHNWESNYYKGISDLRIDSSDESGPIKLVTGLNHTFKVDEVGKKKHIDRMANGRRLFAKYYTSLWI